MLDLQVLLNWSVKKHLLYSILEQTINSFMLKIEILLFPFCVNYKGAGIMYPWIWIANPWIRIESWSQILTSKRFDLCLYKTNPDLSDLLKIGWIRVKRFESNLLRDSNPYKTFEVRIRGPQTETNLFKPGFLVTGSKQIHIFTSL